MAESVDTDLAVVETRESVTENDLLEFDTNNTTLGSEILRVYMGANEDGKGINFKVISRPKLETELPSDYVSYVCQSIGRFMVDSVKHLSVNKN